MLLKPHVLAGDHFGIFLEPSSKKINILDYQIVKTTIKIPLHNFEQFSCIQKLFKLMMIFYAEFVWANINAPSWHSSSAESTDYWHYSTSANGHSTHVECQKSALACSAMNPPHGRYLNKFWVGISPPPPPVFKSRVSGTDFFGLEIGLQNKFSPKFVSQI